MSQIKVLLKQAREAVANDNFEMVMKMCKEILKLDKENYMAMILLGKCFQKLGPEENAPKAFQKAIGWNPTNPLAWQGLIGYYETVNSDEAKEKLITIYESYIKLETNEDKLVKSCKKVLEKEYISEVFELYQSIFEACNRCETNNKLEILQHLLQSLEKHSSFSTNLENLYKRCLENLILLCPNRENNLKYIEFLYKRGYCADAFDKAIKMVQSSDLSNQILENYVCELFNKLFIEWSYNLDEYIDQMDHIIKILLKNDASNYNASISSCIVLLLKNEVLKAKQKLLEIIASNSKLIYLWLLLTDISILTCSTEESLINLQQSLKLLASIKDCSVIAKKIKYQQVQVYSMSHDVQNLLQCVSLYNEPDFPRENCHSIFNAYLILEEYQKCEKYISELISNNKQKADLFQVRLLNKKKEYLESLQLIEKYDYVGEEWSIEKGLTYWNLEQYDKSLECFLKAVEQNTQNYLCYYYLTRYYMKCNKLKDACHYCEIAFQLNTRSPDVGKELCNIYGKQKKWDQYLSMMKSLAGTYATKDNAWVWQHLGLYYLEKDDFPNSRKYLQAALGFDTNNGHLWESLADSYMLRGAYTAAMKAYQASHALCGGGYYPLLQIANIKRILGYLYESKEDFENLLLNSDLKVPVLKGFAETCLTIAKKYESELRLGRARDYFQMSTSKITLAILEQSNLSCLWKILADCAFFVAKLPEKYSYLIILTEIFGEKKTSDAYKTLAKDELFKFASRCYCKALNLSKPNSFDYHDLAACHLTYACHLENVNAKEKYMQSALAAAKKSVTLNVEERLHWILLGNVAMVKSPPDYALAQHCFITAINLNRYDALSWTNLGILYLYLGEIRMANKVFQNALSFDPFYVNSWVGQAIIAEQIQHECSPEAMDLFRHSTEIGQHQQAIRNYAYCLCHTMINNSRDDKNKCVSYLQDSIQLACDKLRYYLEQNRTDATAWTMLGILSEHLNLKYAALEAYRNAYFYNQPAEIDKARINYGRLLYQTNDAKKAIEILTEVSEHTLSSGVELALALYKDKCYEESYNIYEQTLKHLANDEMDQSNILVALASITYEFHDSEATKTLLFQSIHLKERSPWCLYSTLAYALLEKDTNLAELVMKELNILKIDIKRSGKTLSEHIWHYAILIFYFYTSKKDSINAIKQLNQLIHEYPYEAIIWLIASQILAEGQINYPENFTKYAETAIVLGRKNHKIVQMLHLPLLSLYAAKKYKNTLKMGQEIIHLYPHLTELWKWLVSLKINNFKCVDMNLIKLSNPYKCIEQL